MAKFKVGDMVQRKLTAGASDAWRKDNGPFKVVQAYDYADFIRINRVPKGIKGSYNEFSTNSFELAPATVKKTAPVKVFQPNRKLPTDIGTTYIISLKTNDGKLAPAANPAIYYGESQAKAVAASMAEKHPGNEFVILKVVGLAVTAKSIVSMF